MLAGEARDEDLAAEATLELVERVTVLVSVIVSLEHTGTFSILM